MSKLHAFAAVAPALLAGAVLAQLPDPAPEMARLEPLLGSWESEGMMHQPGMPPQPWTARSHARWDLDGHALREDMAISFGPDMPELVMCNYTLWDREHGRFRGFSINSVGEISESTVDWLDDHTLVQLSIGNEEGMPFTERWVIKVRDGKMEFSSTRMSGTDEAVETIRGSSIRTDGVPPIDVMGAPAFAPAAPPVSAAMERLGRMAGRYDLDGTTYSTTGDTQSVEGATDCRQLFGGLVLYVEDNGKSNPYKSTHWMAWSERDGAFRHIALNNVGMGLLGPAQWVGDDAIVLTSSTRMNGAPALDATTLRIDDKGKLAGIVAHTTLGAAAPYRSFEGTWTPAK